MSQGALSLYDRIAEAAAPPRKKKARERAYFGIKGILDRLAAVALLIPGLPLIGLLVVLVRLTSRGPAIYAQERVGRNGRVFVMYKLRSMRSDAESSTGPVWSIPGCDPRVTPLGYWLRKLHLDELPQLFNVLRGEMSLIGPRPERPCFVEKLSRQIPRYRERLRVLPGVTGIAQINLPPDTDLEDVRRKLVLDLEYIDTAHFLLDLRILLCTAMRIVGIQGELATRCLWLRREVPCDERSPVAHLRVVDIPEVEDADPSEADSPHINALTVDVEDYFQVTAFERDIPRSSWNDFEHRVVPNTHRLLELLAEQNVRGTFFILGWTAHRFPQLVRDIQAAGHELASHSYWHRLVYDLTPDQFRQDLRDSRAAIEDAAGQQVTAYRAPSFSITAKSLWALDILAEEGFTTDSSIFPVRHDRYGIPWARRDIFDIPLSAGTLHEFPPTVARYLGMNIPLGGGYFRFYPKALTTLLMQEIEQEQRPILFYVHPWELDPRQPRHSGGSRLSRFRHYVNLETTEQKLRGLLKEFRFGTLSDAMKGHLLSAEAVLSGTMPEDSAEAAIARIAPGEEAAPQPLVA